MTHPADIVSIGGHTHDTAYMRGFKAVEFSLRKISQKLIGQKAEFSLSFRTTDGPYSSEDVL